MEINSPDIDAYWCYLITLVVGVFVGVSKINALMASSPDRWGFVRTWLVLGAYTAVPPLLFWFLDYTGALHDTSIFSALIIAIGYRQILMGEMKSITLAGDISKLWSPFEAWAARVRDHIVAESKRRSDRFEEQLRDLLTTDPKKVDSLIELAYLKTIDPTGRGKLNSDLNSVTNESQPNDVTPERFQNYKIRRKVDICLDAIRSAIPEDWRHVLVKRELIGAYKKGIWQGTLQSRIAAGAVACLFVIAIVWGGFAFYYGYRDHYYRWRFTKVNATGMDRFRSRKFLEDRANERNADTASLFAPLIQALAYRDLNHQICEEILSLLIELHNKTPDSTFQALIAALHTEDPDLRLRVNRTLTALRQLDYAKPGDNDEFVGWVPSKNETAGDIELWIEKYNDWWTKKASGEKSQSRKVPNPSPSATPSSGISSQAGSQQ